MSQRVVMRFSRVSKDYNYAETVEEELSPSPPPRRPPATIDITPPPPTPESVPEHPRMPMPVKCSKKKCNHVKILEFHYDKEKFDRFKIAEEEYRRQRYRS